MEEIKELLDSLVLNKLTNKQRENYDKLSKEEKVIYINKLKKEFDNDLKMKSLKRVLINKYKIYINKKIKEDGIERFI